MKILCLDFESFDPHLLEYGSGSCFKYHYPEVEFEVLGCGLILENGFELYLDFKSDFNGSLILLQNNIQAHDAILCHNSLYDIAILKYLFRDKIVWQDKTLLDTLLLSKHIDQSSISYSLDNLCNVYKCVEKKESDILHDYAWLSGLYQQEKKKEGRNIHTRPTAKTLKTWCMSDMRRFPTDIIKEYCMQDVKATLSLYKVLLDKIKNYITMEVDSDILKCCIDIKFNGIRINVNKAKKLLDKNIDIAKEAENVVEAMLERPKDFNINSSKVLGRLLVADGYIIPRTDKGNISLTGKWLDEQPGEIFSHIRKYRKALKVNEYIRKLINYQKVIPEKYIKNNIGWLYPTLKPYGATTTGRFSSGGGTGCNELNVQQIPRRDEDFGAPIREIFLPHEGEKMVCLDFASQEPRIMVHYATIMGCTGASKIAEAYRQDPNLSYHSLVADLCKINKEHAKTINLGLAYGMGQAKLILSLGLNEQEGKSLLRQYHKLVPFLKELQRVVEKNMLKLGYVKTIGGRKLRLGPNDYSNKSLNKLVQGSAADQTIRAMIVAQKKGLKLLFSVHDEIIISTENVERDTKILQECMCNTVPLCLPMAVDGGSGDSWREAK